MGVYFSSHAIWWDNGGEAGTSGPLGLACDKPAWFGYIYGEYAITITFAPPVKALTITAFDVGVAGACIEAYDLVSGGDLVAYDEAYGSGDGYNQFFSLAVSAPTIARLVCYQPQPSSIDGMMFDNLWFSDVPEPASAIMLMAGGAALLRVRRRVMVRSW